MFDGHGESSVSTEPPCALCQKGEPLRQSHILPEFLYTSVYDENHRFLQVSTDPLEPSVSRPKGLYEPMLCSGCETRLSVWETYASGVLHGGPELRYQMEAGGFVIRGLDYPRFKLFGMSLLWRAGRSRRPEFDAVSLGVHEERLRRMLDAEDPGRAADYGFTIVFPPERQAQELFGQALGPPQRVRYHSHHVYRFLLGVTIWLFPVSSHMRELDPILFSLSEDGSLRIRNGGQPTLDFLVRFGAEITSANRTRGKA